MKAMTPTQRARYAAALVAKGHAPDFAAWVSRTPYDPEHPLAVARYNAARFYGLAS